MHKKTIIAILTLTLSALVIIPSIRTVSATNFTGTIFFTQFSGSVGSVNFTYNPVAPTFSLGSPIILNGALPGGADGLVFNPQNGNLLVGSNNGASFVQEVSPTTGTVLATPSSGTSPLHMMVDPAGTTAWTSGIPGTPASLPLSPGLPGIAPGTPHPLSGDDTRITTIAWKNQSTAFYTSSGGGGFGHFGTINLTTYATTCAKDVTGGCKIFPAAHGMTFDPFTNDLILFGDSQVTQIDPSTLSVQSNLSAGIGNLDQGTVDGKGHLFVACNCGLFFFEDYSASGLVGAAGNFKSNPFLASNLDDVAPLVGSGAAPARVTVSKFFTDTSLNPLPKDTFGNPKVDVVLANGVVRSTNPGEIIAWVNVTNTGSTALQSLKVNESLPVDWLVSPAWLPAKGAIHVYYANTTSLLTNPEITDPKTISVITGNPETVILAIPNLNGTAIGHPLLSGQSILLAVKLDYGLDATRQSASSFPRNYTDVASAAAWTQPSFKGTESSGSGSGFFIAYAKVVGDANGDGKVNIIDLVLVARSFGATPGSANWNSSADVTNDGVIDITALAIVGTYFGS